MRRPAPLHHVIGAGAIVASALVLSCEELPTGPAQNAMMRVRGVTLADWTADGYASESATQAIEDIAAVGSNAVVLIRTAYQSSPGSNDVRIDAERTPTAASLREAAASAGARGLRVVFKPHVDVETGEWRGKITPDDPARWFASYSEFVVSSAAVAVEVGADQFVVGTELAGTIGHEARWRELIARVRDTFPGDIVYASTWDGADRVGFWDAVDFVGVDFYGAVTVRNDPGRLEILAGWQPWLERLARLHRRTGKPILLTEVGYRSVDGAGRAPFAFGDEAPVDTREQADLYWAALEAVGDRGWIEGIYWWNWLSDGSGGEDNDDYTPHGKPAEEELRHAWN